MGQQGNFNHKILCGITICFPLLHKMIFVKKKIIYYVEIIKQMMHIRKAFRYLPLHWAKVTVFQSLMLTVYFKIGLYVDCQCVRWRHLALVTEKLLLIVYIYQSCTIRHLDCHFGCVFAYACLLTLVELSLSHRLLSRPTW